MEEYVARDGVRREYNALGARRIGREQSRQEKILPVRDKSGRQEFSSEGILAALRRAQWIGGL